jgi:hypothetical protein
MLLAVERPADAHPAQPFDEAERQNLLVGLARLGEPWEVQPACDADDVALAIRVAVDELRHGLRLVRLPVLPVGLEGPADWRALPLRDREDELRHLDDLGLHGLRWGL